jgi:TPR repeat protein
MWRTRFSSSSSRTLWQAGFLTAAAASWLGGNNLSSRTSVPCCAAEPRQRQPPDDGDDEDAPRRRLRQRNTLRHADSSTNASSSLLSQVQPVRRINTKEELSKLRLGESAMQRRWERDEDGWRALPARAWPPYQPDPEQLKGIQADIAKHGCTTTTTTTTTTIGSPSSTTTTTTTNLVCQALLFHRATALVFYSVDPAAGYRQYEALAQQDHVDSMVACGVVLMEGMGVPAQETKAVEWLEQAVAHDSPQACYELGTAYYTGIEGGILDEDPVAAFTLFAQAASHGHTAALYMMADCLVLGEGTAVDVARAVPLFYQAAEQGHRYARQRIRELLAQQD